MIPMFSARQSFRRRLHDRQRGGWVTTAFVPAVGRRFRGYSGGAPYYRKFGIGLRLYRVGD
jgi:uncharacterized membrane protein YhaH (DUF805 family)